VRRTRFVVPAAGFVGPAPVRRCDPTNRCGNNEAARLVALMVTDDRVSLAMHYNGSRGFVVSADEDGAPPAS